MGYVMDSEFSLHIVSFYFVSFSPLVSPSLPHTQPPCGGDGAILGFIPPYSTGTPQRMTLP